MQRFLAILVLFAAFRAEGAAQSGSRIDFEHDVQPIFRQHCISCHGPEQQMNGLRLDRRSDAMRGGTQSDIGPGNADGSRLFQRLVGTNFGVRMPPTSPLSTEEIDVIRQWIDEGAEWPDHVSGEAPAVAADPDTTRLNALIRDGDATAIDRFLKNNRTAAVARGSGGTTPLMSAALYGAASLVARVLDAGADPNARNSAGATALMWAIPDTTKMRVLLEAGADVNVRSDDRRTALVIASGMIGGAPAVGLLLDYGADPFVYRADDPSPLREAVRAAEPEIFGLLLQYTGPLGRTVVGPAAFVRTNCAACAEMLGLGGALPRRPPEAVPGLTPTYDAAKGGQPTPIGPTPPTASSIRAAVERSLPLLQDIDVSFVRQTGCVSCHHNSLVANAVATARANGFQVDEGITQRQSTVIGAYLESWRERALQNIPIAGGADTESYLLFGLAASRYHPDAATDAHALLLKRRQSADGHWSLATLRPPIESNDIEVTAVSMRALQAFAPRTHHAEFGDAIARARAWLLTAHADTTEERAFRLLGLAWSGASREAITAAARELLGVQRADGGWAQQERMVSDAYATGEALVALREADAATLSDAAYRRGVEFLLRTQYEDGTWFLETHAVPIQAYFESGFPYGVDQWISAAATAWATTALAMAR